MFEKKAEEYARKTLSKDCCDLKLVVYKKTINSYLAGAEFGYNKANEWHYVKDGDLPKNNTYCLIVKEYEGVTGKYTRCKLSTYKDNSFLIWHHEYDSYVQLHKVIAWKEIVLPELKESE